MLVYYNAITPASTILLVVTIKLSPFAIGQMMSVRPDVLPQEALLELQILQDSVKPFDTVTAVNYIESELGEK